MNHGLGKWMTGAGLRAYRGLGTNQSGANFIQHRAVKVGQRHVADIHRHLRSKSKQTRCDFPIATLPPLNPMPSTSLNHHPGISNHKVVLIAMD